jgi:hypothetical protein
VLSLALSPQAMNARQMLRPRLLLPDDAADSGCTTVRKSSTESSTEVANEGLDHYMGRRVTVVQTAGWLSGVNLIADTLVSTAPGSKESSSVFDIWTEREERVTQCLWRAYVLLVIKRSNCATLIRSS